MTSPPNQVIDPMKMSSVQNLISIGKFWNLYFSKQERKINVDPLPKVIEPPNQIFRQKYIGSIVIRTGNYCK